MNRADNSTDALNAAVGREQLPAYACPCADGYDCVCPVDPSAAGGHLGQGAAVPGDGVPRSAPDDRSAAKDRLPFTEYTFPLKNGTATLYLPVKLGRDDAVRLADYIKALVVRYE